MKETLPILRQDGLIELSSSLLTRLKVLIASLEHVAAKDRLIDTAKLRQIAEDLRCALDEYVDALSKSLKKSEPQHRLIGSDARHENQHAIQTSLARHKAHLRECLQTAHAAYESLIEPLILSLGDDPANTLALPAAEHGKAKSKIVIRVK